MNIMYKSNVNICTYMHVVCVQYVCFSKYKQVCTYKFIADIYYNSIYVCILVQVYLYCQISM